MPKNKSRPGKARFTLPERLRFSAEAVLQAQEIFVQKLGKYNCAGLLNQSDFEEQSIKIASIIDEYGKLFENMNLVTDEESIGEIENAAKYVLRRAFCYLFYRADFDSDLSIESLAN